MWASPVAMGRRAHPISGYTQVESLRKCGDQGTGFKPESKSLGTGTKIPTRHMLDTLGVQTTSDSNVPSGQKLGLLKIYP